MRKRKIFMTAVIKVFISTLEIWFPFMELALLFLLHLGISECHSAQRHTYACTSE